MGTRGGALRARLVVLALVCGAARGGEYGGGGASGPLYGDAAPAQYGAALDYRSPDASALLDYKYVEDSQGNTERSIKDVIDLDTWKKPTKNRVQRRENRSDDRAEVEAVPTPKPRRGRGRARPRARPARPARPEEHARSRRQRYQRARDDDLSPKDYMDRGDHYDNKNKHLDEDFYSLNLEKTTKRIIRRKPRDRLFDNYVKPLKSRDLESEEELISDRKLKSESMEREEPDPEEESEREQAAPGDHASARDEEGEGADGSEARLLPTLYRDDTDYYDMRRLHDINSKLPLLLRRTTTRPPEARDSGEVSTATTADLLALLWTARRRAEGKPHAYAPTPAHSPRGPEATRDGVDPGPSNAHDFTTLTNSRSPPASSSIEPTSELSIAEKSRLSILRKSQKKDSEKGEPSKKPPVLLQVTSKLPTLVMVEPPTSADPWMRARHVSGDSQQKLEKVKSLMRHKLVSGAKNIQDLTDNWDDMVCDYIDVSLLDSAPRRQATMLPLLCSAFALLV